MQLRHPGARVEDRTVSDYGIVRLDGSPDPVFEIIYIHADGL